MPEYMQVIGEDGGVELMEVDGDDYDDVDGYDVGSVLGSVLGGRKGRKAAVKLRKAMFRKGQLAPGVQAPDQGMLPLPMTGNPSNTFSTAVTNITFSGVTQKPYRGERLLVTVVRTGASAVGRILGTLFAGTDLQQADISAMDLETFGDPTAFGVRLTMTPVQPGVLMRIPCSLSTALAGADTVQVNVNILGRVVH